MNLLAIDASQGTALAVTAASNVLARRVDEQPRHHVESIGTLIREMLVEATLSVTELDGVVVGIGPGGFSGLRVGIAAALGISIGANIPIWGVRTHDAIAFGNPSPDHALCVATDARRHEYFVTVFHGVDDAGLPIVAEEAHTMSEPPLGALVDIPVDASWLAGYAPAALAAGQPLPEPRPYYVRRPDVAPPRQRLQ